MKTCKNIFTYLKRYPYKYEQDVNLKLWIVKKGLRPYYMLCHEIMDIQALFGGVPDDIWSSNLL